MEIMCSSSSSNKNCSGAVNQFIMITLCLRARQISFTNDTSKSETGFFMHTLHTSTEEEEKMHFIHMKIFQPEENIYRLYQNFYAQKCIPFMKSHVSWIRENMPKTCYDCIECAIEVFCDVWCIEIGPMIESAFDSLVLCDFYTPTRLGYAQKFHKPIAFRNTYTHTKNGTSNCYN